MRHTLIVGLGAAALLALCGQGCAMQQQTSVSSTGSSAQSGTNADIDAAVNASITGAEKVQTEEKGADADANTVSNDSAELDMYSQGQYEIK